MTWRDDWRRERIAELRRELAKPMPQTEHPGGVFWAGGQMVNELHELEAEEERYERPQ